ncbi:MAG: TonB-dependent receptor [Pseudomonadota bacterium]
MRTLLATSAALLALCAHADETPKTLDEIIVTTATRTETDLDGAFANVRVVTRDDILRSGATDSLELLRYFAGIDIARTGGPGQQTSIFTRGTESNHTLVLLDGVRMNPAAIGVPAIQNVTPEQIERIEFVTGPRSALYGSDAIGGVINIVTTGDTPERAVSIGGGTNNTERAGLQWGYRSGDTVFRISADQLRTGGIPTRVGDANDRGYDNTSVRLSFATLIGGGRLEASHWQADGDAEYSDFFLNPVSQSFENQVSAVSWERGVSDTWRTKVAVGRFEDDLAQRESPDFLNSERLTLDWQNTIDVGGGHTLVAGAYLAEEQAESLSFGLAFDEDADIRALYLQDQYQAERWQGLVSVRATDHDAFGSEVTWNLGFGIDVNERLTLQIDAGTAFRAPDMTDRFGFGGNQDLEAETAEQLQLRAIYRTDNGWRLGLEAFRTDIDNLIEFDFVTFQLFNIAEAEIEGISADARWLNENWQVELGVTYQDARDAIADTRLLRRARVSTTAKIARKFGPHSVDLSVNSSDSRRDFGGIALEGFNLIALAGRFALTDALSLTARIDNVGDERYETAAGFNQLGRTTTVQLRYQW